MKSPHGSFKTFVNRRQFLNRLAAGLGALGSISILSPVSPARAADLVKNPAGRLGALKRLRLAALDRIASRGELRQRNNGEEQDYPYDGNYSKGLLHNEYGEVVKSRYVEYLSALKKGTQAALERIHLPGSKKLKNPLAGLAYGLNNFDVTQYKLPVAPRLNKAWCSAEAAELYWMSLLRDVHFSDYASSTLVQEAAADLSNFSDLRAPRQNGALTSDYLFRMELPGVLSGPYVSQYLYQNVGYISLSFEQKQVTVEAGTDYLSDPELWLFAMNGNSSFTSTPDATRRYIRNGRDLAAYVRTDYPHQAYLHAALILLFGDETLNPDFAVTELDAGHPYYASGTQSGFATFGYAHLLSLLGEVATRALQACWYQKWYVHRRLRPEEYGGRIHFQMTGQRNYSLNNEILNSTVLDRIFSQHGSYFLPQAHPFGCPLHPAYPSGHATVSGACATVLKAWFREDSPVSNPVVASADGTALENYTGVDAGVLTVGGEINKLAANIAMARNFAGIHWRSDALEGLRLGERVAIDYLRELVRGVREEVNLSVTRFNGTRVRISN